MDKVFTFLMIVVSISFLLWAAGYGSSGSVFTMINAIISGEDFQLNMFWIALYGVIGTIGLIAGYQAAVFGNASAAMAAGAATMSIFLVSFISDIIYVLNKASEKCLATPDAFCGVTQYIIAFICVPLAVGFAWSIGQLAFGGGD